ncbi:MAG TPA: hypothetical protein VJH22_04230 [Candidatus Nanoarchaeia archaeon]|nr:hypothetical protein [Candidatus Nanoarchaeia archaeon]
MKGQLAWTRKDILVVSLMFALTVGIRLYFALQVPYVIGSESFYWQRQVDSILESGTPLHNDLLFSGGRTFEGSPLFAYLLAIPSYFLGFEFGSKILLNIASSLLTILAFLICKKTTSSKYVAYLTSFFAGFIPVIWERTVHTVTIYAITIPLLVWCINCFLDITHAKKYRVWWYALSLLFFSILHSSVLILIAGLLVYLVMLKVESLEVSKSELEIIVFSTLVAFIVQMTLYRQVLFAHGIGVIWQNIPDQIVGKYFAETTLLEAFYRIGEIPVFFGMIIIAKYLFRQKDKIVYLFISFALAVGVALYLRLLEPWVGMMVLGAILVLLFSFYYTFYLDYVPSTKFARFLPVLKVLFFVTFILTSALPALDLVVGGIEEAAMDRRLPALQWLKAHTQTHDIILAPISDAAMIASLADRVIVADTSFLMVHDAKQRQDAIDLAFTSPYESFAVEAMEELGVRYVYVNRPALARQYGVETLPFISPEGKSDCFSRVYEGGVEIFRRTCEVRLIS